jgi:hypothetical protein
MKWLSSLIQLHCIIDLKFKITTCQQICTIRIYRNQQICTLRIYPVIFILPAFISPIHCRFEATKFGNSLLNDGPPFL